MRFESPLLHSLPHLQQLKELYRKPAKTRQEELFLASELTSQGFAEAGEYIATLRRKCINKARQNFLSYLLDQSIRIQGFENLQSNLHDNDLIVSMYRRDGVYFEKGNQYPQKLLVVFTTMFNNYYLSNLVTLTFLRRFGVSILLLKDSSVFNYLKGVNGTGRDLLEIAKAVETLVARRGIREVFITGFSSSGYASLLMSSIIRCDGYLGFSIRSDLSPTAIVSPGKFFTPQVREMIPATWRLDLAAVLAASRKKVRRKILYGSLSALDAEHALRLRDVNDMSVEMIKDCGHLTVAAMLVNDTLEPEFRSLLFGIH